MKKDENKENEKTENETVETNSITHRWTPIVSFSPLSILDFSAAASSTTEVVLDTSAAWVLTRSSKRKISQPGEDIDAQINK